MSTELKPGVIWGVAAQPLMTCTKCGAEKHPRDFPERKDGGVVTVRKTCRACVANRQREYDKSRPTATALRRMMGSAKKRASLKGIKCDLAPHREQLIERLSTGHCELTGIPFAFNTGELWDSPTIDRLDPNVGYVYSNVRLVIFAANTMLGNWGEDTAARVAEAFLSQRTKANDTERTVEEL